MASDLKVGMTVVANSMALGWPYRAEIEDIYDGKALLLPLEVPFTASSARTRNYKKRRRWVRLDRLQPVVDDIAEFCGAIVDENGELALIRKK